MNTNTALITPPFSTEYYTEYIKSMEYQLVELYDIYSGLEHERSLTGNPQLLVNTLFNVIWEQFLNQIAYFVGEEFIKENRGLFLDLSDDAHIPTTNNFIAGKLPKHNPYINFEQRSINYQSHFKKDEYGNSIKKIDSRTGLEKEVITTDARKLVDSNRPRGTASNHIDHIIAWAELLRNPDANTHLTQEELIAFANSEYNLHLLDSAANCSKGDSDMETWLSSKRNGQTPAERFHQDEKALLKKDAIARQELQKRIDAGKAKSIETGKKSQKEEALRIKNKAFESALMTLFANFLKTIAQKMIVWLQGKDKDWNSFCEQIKAAIEDFFTDLNYIISAGKATITTIATAIYGSIISTINKVWLLIQQGGNSLCEAISYIKNPENRSKPFHVLALEIGKIFIAGLTGVGAIMFSEIIEKHLPDFLASRFFATLLGNFLGSIATGIIGALFLYWIDIILAKRQNNQLSKQQGNTLNKILETEIKIGFINNVLYENAKTKCLSAYNQAKNMEVANE